MRGNWKKAWKAIQNNSEQTMQTRESIIAQFFPSGIITELKPFGNGHINDTFKVSLDGEKDDFILQRINVEVFTKPDGLVENHFMIQEYLETQNPELEVPSLLPVSTGGYLVMDQVKGAWRMMNFIRESHSVEIVTENSQASEAGGAFGWFNRVCASLDASRFSEAIKDFHRLSFRLRQLDEAIEANKAGRVEEVQDILDFYGERREKLQLIEKLVDAGEIPERVTHNDTKINNLLFRGNKACAVIDLDTVGPGILFYDFGDSIRTISNTAAEDEKDLDKVQFNAEAYEAFARGYLEQVKPVVTEKENEFFHLAPVLMTYIMGIRFLADYLNGDVYYKIAFPEHNIVRSRVQQKLIQCMEQNGDKIRGIINEALA